MPVSIARPTPKCIVSTSPAGLSLGLPLGTLETACRCNGLLSSPAYGRISPGRFRLALYTAPCHTRVPPLRRWGPVDRGGRRRGSRCGVVPHCSPSLHRLRGEVHGKGRDWLLEQHLVHERPGLPMHIHPARGRHLSAPLFGNACVTYSTRATRTFCRSMRSGWKRGATRQTSPAQGCDRSMQRTVGRPGWFERLLRIARGILASAEPRDHEPICSQCASGALRWAR